MINTFNDFMVPLMRILDQLPARAGQAGEVLILFEQTYHDQLPPNQFTENPSGRIRWQHNVRWSREKLKLLGFIDAPKVGTWHLTDAGHSWLTNNPNVSRLSKGLKRKNPNLFKDILLQKESSQHYSVNEKKNFFIDLERVLSQKREINDILQHISFFQRSNFLQLHIEGYQGCHYEIIIRRDIHEIALHFESIEERSKDRLAAFEPHINTLSEKLGEKVFAGMFQSRGWTKVCIELPNKQLSRDYVTEFADLIMEFITETYPILKDEYSSYKYPRKLEKRTTITVNDNSIDTIVERELNTIRSFINGQSVLMISDEKLCDWVNFLYILELYSEATDLFLLISSDGVNPWYYERTKKIVKACELRAKGK